MKASRSFFTGSAVALLPFAAAFAQSPTPDQTAPQSPPQSPPEQSQPSAPQAKGTTFESLDVDGDGRISKAEAEVSANVSAQFSKYDQNGDGFIERAEVNSANSPPPQTPQQ